MTEHDPYLDRFLKWMVVAATIFLVMMFAAVVATPAEAAVPKAAVPKAHVSYIAGVTVCGFWANHPVYIPCQWGYLQRRVRDIRNIRAATPLRKDFRNLGTSIAHEGDYGPNSWWIRFRVVYNEPTALKRVKVCAGTLIVNARTGRNIRIQNKHGGGC